MTLNPAWSPRYGNPEQGEGVAGSEVEDGVAAGVLGQPRKQVGDAGDAGAVDVGDDGDAVGPEPADQQVVAAAGQRVGPLPAVIYAINVAGTIQNSTIASNTANSGGGIRLTNPGTITLQSSIIADNTATGGIGHDVAGTGNITVASSLIENTAGGTITDNGGNVTGTDPGLQALANNGGPVNTLAILSGSAAFNTGSNPAGLSTDGRGSGFDRVSDGTADMGAFELEISVQDDGGGGSTTGSDGADYVLLLT